MKFIHQVILPPFHSPAIDGDEEDYPDTLKKRSINVTFVSAKGRNVQMNVGPRAQLPEDTVASNGSRSGQKVQAKFVK
ncbi:MAG: hypothetical protein ABI980_12975 [Nitrospirota bacterium]